MATQTATAEATVDRLLKRVRKPLIEIEQKYRARGRSVADTGLETIARRMAAVVPAPSPVNELFGPFFRTEQVVNLLGISRQGVHERVKKRSLLAMRTSDGAWVYPTLQFQGRRVLAGLPALLRCFSGEHADGWAVAAWLVSPHAGLDGKRPLCCISRQDDLETAKLLARDASRRWGE